MKIMNRSWYLLVVMFVLAACGGGGGDSSGDSGSSDVASLQGTWYGGLADNTDNDVATMFHTVQVVIDGSGNITSISVDAVDAGLTGTITKTGNDTFSFVFSDGTTGGFLSDASRTHMGFIDDDINFGVLEKGASGLPVYQSSDIFGDWSGYSVELAYDLSVTGSATSSANVTNTFDFSGSDSTGANFNGTLLYWLQSKGVIWGGWSDSTLASGDVLVWLSPDKQFVGAWACDQFYGAASQTTIRIYDVTGCSFSMWTKN